MLSVSSSEQQAIRDVVSRGKLYGFGNMISHLASAWAESLMRDYGFSEEQALMAVGERHMPVQMHRDIMDAGEWDETGRRYMKQAG